MPRTDDRRTHRPGVARRRPLPGASPDGSLDRQRALGGVHHGRAPLTAVRMGSRDPSRRGRPAPCGHRRVHLSGRQRSRRPSRRHGGRRCVRRLRLEHRGGFDRWRGWGGRHDHATRGSRPGGMHRGWCGARPRSGAGTGTRPADHDHLQHNHDDGSTDPGGRGVCSRNVAAGIAGLHRGAGPCVG